MRGPVTVSLRWIGIAVLAVLLWQLDQGRLIEILSLADVRFVVIAVALHIPLVGLKAWRWCELLKSQHIQYGIGPAMLSYFGGIFIGLLTPGRLGEFVKAFHASQDCGVSIGRAFSSVLADRLFDLYALALVGGVALWSLTTWSAAEHATALLLLGLLFTFPLIMLLYGGNVFAQLKLLSGTSGRVASWLKACSRWYSDLQDSFRELSFVSLLLSAILTTLAYIIFFFQCYLLALALHISTDFVTTSYAVALGGLVTLLPISISGLGTREATIVAYLGAVGVPPETALSFSLLVFVTFYVAGGLMGAVVQTCAFETAGNIIRANFYCVYQMQQKVWMPACAGMTEEKALECHSRESGNFVFGTFICNLV